MTMKKPSRLAREIAEMTDAQRRLGVEALPFEKREPNKITAETIAKSERGEDVHKAKDAEDLFSSWVFDAGSGSFRPAGQRADMLTCQHVIIRPRLSLRP